MRDDVIQPETSTHSPRRAPGLVPARLLGMALLPAALLAGCSGDDAHSVWALVPGAMLGADAPSEADASRSGTPVPTSAPSHGFALDPGPASVPGGVPDAASTSVDRAAAQIDESRRTAIVQAASRVGPAVVTINTSRTERVRPRSMWESFFLPPNAQRRVSGLGSGFVIDADEGWILTNEHVVSGADRVLVTFPDGRDFEARIVGTDPLVDVALVAIDPETDPGEPLPEAPLGTSEGLLIGEWVVAIGNPFGYLISNSEPSVTAGVISALGRHIVPEGGDSGRYLGMIQTDASINPGNSGGPLINALGQVVGVNSSIFTRSGGSEGLGFAIPIDRALRIARDLADDGIIERAWLGIEVEAAEADDWGRTRGVMISRVVGGSPAAEAGLRPGRRVLAANGRRLAAPLDWEDALLELRPGERLRLDIENEGEVTLGAAALPSLEAKRVRVLDDLEVVTLTRAIQAERGLASEAGALVIEVGLNLQQRTGLQPGDVLVQVNNVRIESAEQARDVLQRLRPGRTRFVMERRGGYVYQDVNWQP